MKGIIFNLLEDAVMREHGEFAWVRLLDMAGLDSHYSSLGSYPDTDLIALVDAATVMMGINSDEVLRWFGRMAMPTLAERFGDFFRPHRTLRGFLVSVNDIIHPEVHKLYGNVRCPAFHFHDLADGGLGIGYRSPRRMCQLAHGFIEGAAGLFREQVAIAHQSCMHDGDPLCRLAVNWVP